jgi:hypothetical protein
MLRTIKRVIPRTQGQGWNIQKFHELLHVPMDVEMFGSPKNFDTGIMENRLIHVGKHNSKNTQKRGPQTYTRQLGLRIQEQQMFAKTKRCLDIQELNYETDTLEDDAVNGVAQYVTRTSKDKPCYRVEMEGRFLRVCWLTSTRRDVPEPVLLHLKTIMNENHLEKLDIYTEIQHNGKTYRGHPNYRGGGPWYDWGAVRFTASPEDLRRQAEDRREGIYTAYPPGHYPSKIFCFFYINNQLHFVCQTTSTKLSSTEDSCLTERWNLQYRPRRVGQGNNVANIYVPMLEHHHVTCIHERLYVIEESPGFHDVQGEHSSLVVVVKNRLLWPRYFTET